MPKLPRQQPTLDALLRKAIDFLDRWKMSYVLVGGLAVGIVGEARVTEDVDLVLNVSLRDLKTFAQRALAADFVVVKASLEEAATTGALRLTWRGLHMDVIFASTAFEQSVFSRKRHVRLAGRITYVPTPEDLILLKLVPGRPKDLFDVESVIVRHRGRLDQKYLEHWAQRLSDDVEDMKIWNRLQRVLQDTT